MSIVQEFGATTRQVSKAKASAFAEEGLNKVEALNLINILLLSVGNNIHPSPIRQEGEAILVSEPSV